MTVVGNMPHIVCFPKFADLSSWCFLLLPVSCGRTYDSQGDIFNPRRPISGFAHRLFGRISSELCAWISRRGFNYLTSFLFKAWLLGSLVLFVVIDTKF